MTKEKCQELIEKYNKKGKEQEEERRKLIELNNGYCIKRPEIVALTFGGVTTTITIIFMFLFLILMTIKEFSNFSFNSCAFILGFILSDILISTFIIIWLNLKYKYLFVGKTKFDIIKADFENIAKIQKHYTTMDIYADIAHHFEMEMEAIENKENILDQLGKEYEITIKDKVKSSDNTKEREGNLDVLSKLVSEYEKKLSFETEKLIMTKYFKNSFKPYIQELSMNGMCLAVVFILIMLPPITALSRNTASNFYRNVNLGLLFGVIIPCIVGLSLPFIWNSILKGWYKKVFEEKNKVFNLPTDKYVFELEEEISGNIDEIKEKLEFSIVELELAQID